MARCVVKHQSERGLTLLELLVVIVLLALVTATVTVKIGGRWPEAALGEAIAQWEFSDDQLRTRARRTGQALALHVDVGASHWECAFDPQEPDARTIRTLPRGVRLARILSVAGDITAGPAVIRYGPAGTTETYVLQFESGRKLRRWILVAGLTGQMSVLNDEKEAQQILEVLSKRGVHAG